MTPNDKLPEEIQEQISKDADEYARTFSGTRSIKRPYRAGATAWAQWKSKHDEVKVAAEKLRLALVMAVFALKQSYDVNDFPADGQTNQDSAIRIGEEALQQFKDGGKEDKVYRPCPHCGKELFRDRNLCCRACGKEVESEGQ